MATTYLWCDVRLCRLCVVCAAGTTVVTVLMNNDVADALRL